MICDLVLGIDCSTTAAKAVVWDANGRSLAEGRASFALSSPHPGWGEQNPVDWWLACVKAMTEACSKIDASRVAALAVTCQRETFVCLDADGEALRPAMLWLDTRAGEQVATHGSAAVHEITGKPPNTATSWYKLLWLKKHEPRVLERTCWVSDVHGYIVHRLTGRWRTSYGSVDPMGVLNLKSLNLDADLLAQAGLEPGQIPEIFAPGERLGELREDVAAAVGLTPGLPIIAGTGDGQAAGLGADITVPGRAYLSLGTGMVSGIFSADYRWQREFRTMTGAIPGTYTPETFIGGGTYNISWFVERFAEIPARPFGLDLAPEALLELAAAKIPAGSEGLLTLPYLSGAMSPYWDSNARGLYFGLSPRHGKAHLYRALLEGLALEQRLATDSAEAGLGTPIERFRVMGGGSRSVVWSQIIADVLKRPVEITREAETTCLGAGMLAAAGVGLHPDILRAASAMSGISRTYLPGEPACSIYDQYYEVYRQLYPSLRESFGKLQEIAKTSTPAAQ